MILVVGNYVAIVFCLPSEYVWTPGCPCFWVWWLLGVGVWVWCRCVREGREIGFEVRKRMVFVLDFFPRLGCWALPPGAFGILRREVVFEFLCCIGDPWNRDWAISSVLDTDIFYCL